MENALMEYVLFQHFRWTANGRWSFNHLKKKNPMWLNHPSFTPTDSLFFSCFKLDVIFSDKVAVRFSSLVANKEDGR